MKVSFFYLNGKLYFFWSFWSKKDGKVQEPGETGGQGYQPSYETAQ